MLIGRNFSTLTTADMTCYLWLVCLICICMLQVETLVELRAIQLEQRGKMSRYGPLVVLEAIK